ncbi:MAG: hypothetical protein AAF471_03075 [Myxococcota bacterium]
MIGVLIAISCGLVTFGAVTAWMGWVSGIFPGLVTTAAVYWWISRKVARAMEQGTKQIQAFVQRGQLAQAIDLLQQMQQRYSRWQPFVRGSLAGEIGTLYYMKKDFTRAQPHLAKAFIKHWFAKTMLGVLHYRAKEYAKMDKVFTRATWFSPKQGLLWNTWAYCLWRLGKTQQAIDVLRRAKHKLGERDPRVNANLLNLQNGKQMKMHGYSNQWYALQLELPPMPRMGRAREGRGQRASIRRF